MKKDAEIPRLLREARRRSGLSQEKLAAKLGVSFTTINRWENAHAHPSPLARTQIAALFEELNDQGAKVCQERHGDPALPKASVLETGVHEAPQAGSKDC